MSSEQFSVVFEVPESIQTGLETGQLRRVGGVIIDDKTEQIVAWLRDGSLTENSTQGDSLNLILNASQAAGQLIEIGLARQSVAQAAQLIGSLTLTGQVINLAIAAATFQTVLHRLDLLQQEVASVRAEFDQDRDMRFKVALQAARDVLETQHDLTRESAIRSAIDGLYEARENFFANYHKLITQGKLNFQKIYLAEQYLIRATYAEISRVRSYLISGDVELARQRLTEDLPRFEQLTKQLVRLMVGNKPAKYFHPQIAPQHLQRFLVIEQWLRGVRGATHAPTLFSIINEARHDFWTLDPFDLSLRQRLAPQAHLLTDEERDAMIEHLAHAELLIENFERLCGFALEVRTLRLSFAEWTDLVPEANVNEHGIALILNENIDERESAN